MQIQTAANKVTAFLLAGVLLGRCCLLPIHAQESGTASAPTKGDLIDTIYMSYLPMRSLMAKQPWENLRAGVGHFQNQEPENQNLQMLASFIEGEIARTDNQFDVAHRKFQQASYLEPTASLPYLGLAETAIDQEQTDKAAPMLSLAQIEVPKSIPAHLQYTCYYRIGELYERVGKYTDAIHAYELAIAAKPDWAHGQSTLARIYLVLNEPSKAFDHAQQAVVLNPKDASGYSILGDVQSRLGRKTLALSSLRKAVELDPGDALSHYRLGLELEDQGDKILAMRSYLTAKTIVDRTHNSADLSRDLGEAIARLEK